MPSKQQELVGVSYFLLGNQRLLVQKDEKAAFTYFLKSSLLGCIAGTSVLAFFFEFGLAKIAADYQANYQVAERLYTSAAAQGSGLAQARLAFLKTHGRPQIKIDQSLAEAYRRACGKQGASSVAWLAQAAEAGLAPAQFCLALCYYNGIAVPEDDTSAFRWCERAAAQGHAGAQNVLGNLYVEGAGCEVNATIGLRWYIKAAEQREAAAIYNIGTLFERGLAVDEDPHQAFEWYVRAAMFGSINAQNVLGIFYEQGIGVMQNPQLAVQNYTKAALSGHPHAQYNLGRCHHDGFGAERDDRLASRWFEMAALQNHSLSQLSMAVCCEFGIGVTLDRKRAMGYYRRAASNDCPEARRRLQPVIACQILIPARILLAGRVRPRMMSAVVAVVDDIHMMETEDSNNENWLAQQPELVSVRVERPKPGSYVRLLSSPPPLGSGSSDAHSSAASSSDEEDAMDVDPRAAVAGPTPPPTPVRNRSGVSRSPTVTMNVPTSHSSNVVMTPQSSSTDTMHAMMTPPRDIVVVSNLNNSNNSNNNNNNPHSNLITAPNQQHNLQAGLHSLPVEILEYILSFLDPLQILTPQQLRQCCSTASDRRSLSGPIRPLIHNEDEEMLDILDEMDVDGEIVPRLSKSTYLARVGCPRFLPRCECMPCAQIKHLISALEVTGQFE
ncbi:hypothetical protein SmJEL517_g04945 [Synchytrium microbalum]|uniref:F-box domain-containing protein n=1 Tax=Synchytrium microbalum TaxID=1806994 RepID=A0A507BP76_9FUNG|nr:uncharacterized protein SmJEL517_g04945 [Synchytrium microbalum]TPX31810.1 hypothetical protein SmJEL517_g04945 [Synchytrium microbalum]